MNTRFIEGMKERKNAMFMGCIFVNSDSGKELKFTNIKLPKLPPGLHIYTGGKLKIKPTQMEEDKKWIGHGLDGSEF